MTAGDGYRLLEYDLDRIEAGDEHYNYSREMWMPHEAAGLVYQEKIHFYPMRRKLPDAPPNGP